MLKKLHFASLQTLRKGKAGLLGLGCAFLLGCAGPRALVEQAPAQPEGASGYSAKSAAATQKTAVAAANPLAAAVGRDMLRAGGSAIDAAVAVQMVLGLVEPQSSGLGGGAFLLHFDGKRVQSWDGRETAPAAADEKLLLGPDGQPLPFFQAAVGGRAVGVPGAVRMLEAAHQQHGRLPWAQLLQPAIALAEQGFAISPRLHALLAQDRYLQADPLAAKLYYAANGQALPVGSLVRNPEYAAVLRLIAAQGSKGLLEGELARALVAAVRSHPSNPGLLTTSDLRDYQAKERAPLCFEHRAGPLATQGGVASAGSQRSYRICGMAPPNSGSIAIGQILGILSYTQASAQPLQGGLPSPQWLHLYTEASRLAFADRAQYVADPDFVAPPAQSWQSLLQPSYLARRASLIDTRAGSPRMANAPAGAPLPGEGSAYAPMADQPEYGTSHMSIVDAWGNALAMTSSIETAFGARLMVNRGQGLAGGFLLNHQLTDFSFAPSDAQGRPMANRAQGGKRPRSSMSPLLVFDTTTGQTLMALGSPGGAAIIHFNTKALYGMLHWGLGPQAAVDMPNFGALDDLLLVEKGRFPSASMESLGARGHRVREFDLPSGLQLIVRTPQGWQGAADPRREGVVLGD